MWGVFFCLFSSSFPCFLVLDLHPQVTCHEEIVVLPLAAGRAAHAYAFHAMSSKRSSGSRIDVHPKPPNSVHSCCCRVVQSSSLSRHRNACRIGAERVQLGRRLKHCCSCLTSARRHVVSRPPQQCGACLPVGFTEARRSVGSDVGAGWSKRLQQCVAHSIGPRPANPGCRCSVSLVCFASARSALCQH